LLLPLKPVDWGSNVDDIGAILMLDLVHILDLNGGTLDSSKACAFEGQSAKCPSKALGRVCECQQIQNTKETVPPSNQL